MEITCEINSQCSAIPRSDVDYYSEDTDVQSNHEDVEPKCDFSDEEARGIMEVIATTGKYWHDWDILKRLLSFQLKQVLAEYLESQTVSGSDSQQSSLCGETYTELVNKLDEALLSFMEGPPFTLQRLCEILLAPKGLYPKLSKLALALEKNLSVTSTLTVCTDPYPPAISEKAETDEANIGIENDANLVQNGNETAAGDGDEEMAEVETEDNSNNDTAMQEKVCEPPESSTEPSTTSDPSKDLCPLSVQHGSTNS